LGQLKKKKKKKKKRIAVAGVPRNTLQNVMQKTCMDCILHFSRVPKGIFEFFIYVT
jgi:hypothetical protein